MIKPKPLSKGDLIEIVSPAGKIDPALIDAAAKCITAEGYRVRISANAKGKHNKFSGTDEERYQDLQNAIDDPEVKAILCSRGGYGSMRYVDKIKWRNALYQRKLLIGFSDITALHAAAYKNGLITMHGLMAKYIVNGKDEAVEQFFKLISGRLGSIEFGNHKLNRGGDASGILLGGNLSMLYALRGTAYDLNYDNSVLFIEDIGENLYHLDRIMQNFRLGGKLKNLKALIVGQFTDMTDPEFGKTAYEIIQEAVKEYNYPVAFDIPVGHVDNSLSLLHGDILGVKINNSCSELIINNL